MKYKKKLFIINGAQFGHSSGHYFYCKYLRDSFQIKYVCFDRGLKRSTLSGVDISYVPYTGSRLKRITLFIIECIKQSYILKPNIIFVTYFNLCFLLAWFCKSEKTVLDIRTGSLKDKKIIRKLDNYYILFQSFFFHRIVILSERLRKKLCISEGKRVIIPLGSEVIFGGNHIFNTINLLYIGTLNDRHISETIRGLYLFLQNMRSNLARITYKIIGFGTEAEISTIMNCISENRMSDIVSYVEENPMKN